MCCRVIAFFVIFKFVLPTSLIAQADTTYLTSYSKMWFISEIDHSVIMMDEEGKQFDYYNNYIMVDYQGKKLKVPYNSNYIFWDEYDENMHVSKKAYRIILAKVTHIKKKKTSYSLFKVFEGTKLVYDATKSSG